MTRDYLQSPSWTAALAFVLATAACSAPEVTDATVTHTDSAGVRVITSESPDRELAWRFDTVGVLRDSLGEPWLFEGITTRRVVTDRLGRTYVLTADPAVIQFARDGAYLRSFGRKGGAPGEMEYPTVLMQQGDSLAALDHQRGVLVRWGPTLEPINDLSLRGALSDASDLRFRSGGVWVRGSAFSPEGTRIYLSPDTVGSENLMEVMQGRTTSLEACGIRIALPPFFGRELHWGTAGPRLLASAGPDYDLRLYEGPRLVASIRRALPTRAPTEDDVKQLYPEGFTIRALNGPTCTFPHALVMTVGLAETMPFVFALTLLSDGTMWVQRSFHTATFDVLDVFGSDGAYVGTIRGMALPVGLLPSGELLVPVEDAESGGQHIVRVRVTR